MARSAIGNATARLEQLCCLGLKREHVLPALLDELHTIVPFSGCTVFFVDARLRVTNSHREEFNPATAALYLQ